MKKSQSNESNGLSEAVNRISTAVDDLEMAEEHRPPSPVEHKEISNEVEEEPTPFKEEYKEMAQNEPEMPLQDEFTEVSSKFLNARIVIFPTRLLSSFS